MKASDNGFESLCDSASPPDTHTPIGSILMETSTAHQQMMYGSSTEDSEGSTAHSTKRHALRRLLQIRVPARLFESPRHSGATDEGVTPQLLSMRVPGACHGWRPTRGPLVDTDM